MSGKKIRVFDTFAGYGGAHFGFKKTKIPHEVVGFSEIDSYADYIYKHNHGDIKNYGDITKINPKDLPDFDILCAGFPCQPFSQAGHKRGFDDNHNSERGNLFFNISLACVFKYGEKCPP